MSVRALRLVPPRSAKIVISLGLACLLAQAPLWQGPNRSLVVPAAVAYSSHQPLYNFNPFEWQYQQVWDLVDRYFLYRDRLSNWAAWRHRFDGRLDSPQETQQAIDLMLDSLHDDYTFFRNVEATERRKAEDNEHNVVTFKMLSARVAYVHISTFSSRFVVPEMRQALKQMHARSLVLDLRDNKGGSIDDAFRVFQLLCPQGTFVRMVGSNQNQDEDEVMKLTSKNAVLVRQEVGSPSAREQDLLMGRRLLVLVDQKTKSAAEMLAGALRDDHRAVLVGHRTFGKGVIQRVWEFENGTSVKITAARYYLPSGANIQGVGLRPDVSVPNSAAQVHAALQLFSDSVRPAGRLRLLSHGSP